MREIIPSGPNGRMSRMLKIDLMGKSALVTGGSGELGRVMCRTLARCGANVAVHYFNGKERATRVRDELVASGVKAIAVQADVGDERSVFEMRDAVVREIGAPDIIVNNAVTQYPWTSVLEQSLADYESQFRSSILHNVLMAKAFVPAMRERGWGRVIAISTECAMQNAPSQSAYVAGKRGMDGVLRVLAREVGSDHITVNQVAPGWTISESKPEDEKSEPYRKNVPLRRRGTDQEIANAVAFLASDLAAFITGVYLPVCGGNVMPSI
jgi:3-oxoacyl-[acyl-carrier protein] reductase